MNEELTRHVKELHSKAFTVDAHFDLPFEVANQHVRGNRQVIENQYLEGFRSGGFNLIVSAIFIENIFLPEMGLRKALDQISYLHEELDESGAAVAFCRNTRQAHGCRDAGKIGLMLSLEGADPIQNDLSLLRIFYELGVRGLGLVWSRRNYAGDGAFFHDVREGRKGGLTAFGLDLIEKAEALGMFIDVSHINDEGFEDVLAAATQPVIASHSNCRALAPSRRNLTDAQIEALAEKGGVIGVNAIDAFVRDNQTDATVDALIDHVDHIVQVAGIAHVGIGLDLCGSFIDYHHMPKPLVTQDVIKGHQDLGALTAGLIERGYSDEDILRILGGNFMRVFEQILG